MLTHYDSRFERVASNGYASETVRFLNRHGGLFWGICRVAAHKFAGLEISHGESKANSPAVIRGLVFALHGAGEIENEFQFYYNGRGEKLNDAGYGPTECNGARGCGGLDRCP
jgi:hypothetical protein